jgi:hypothetical protein
MPNLNHHDVIILSWEPMSDGGVHVQAHGFEGILGLCQDSSQFGYMSKSAFQSVSVPKIQVAGVIPLNMYVVYNGVIPKRVPWIRHLEDVHVESGS